MEKLAHLKIPLEDILSATDNFADANLIRKGGFGRIYRGKLARSGETVDIVARRLDDTLGQGIKEFWTEILMLYNLKHPNLVSLIGFCEENDEKIIVNKHEANGSLDNYLSDPAFTWTRRLQVCLDVARALSYIHYDKQRNFSVIHRNLKSSKILLDEKWEAKISGFGLSKRCQAARRHDLVIDEACGTFGYVDPAYIKSGSVNHKSDVYSLGVILFEVICGRKAFEDVETNDRFLSPLAISHYEAGNLDDIIHPSLRVQMDSKSLKLFSEAAYCCLKEKRSQRPHIDRIIVALEKALEHQLKRENSEHSIVEAQGTSTSYLEWFRSNDERYEIIRARQFSYEDSGPHQWRCVQESRFQEVAEMFDPTNLNIRIKNRTELLSADVLCGVYLVFKFCDARKNTSKPMYVNLNYRHGSETLCAYFATCRDDGWMTIELCRVMNNSQDFEFLLQSMSQYCSEDGIYVEGLEIRTFGNAKNDETKKLMEVQVIKSNLNADHVQNSQTNLEENVIPSQDYTNGDKLFWRSEVNGKKHLMLSAKECMCNFRHVKLFSLKPSAESRFQEVIELLPQRVFLMSCMIDSQMLSQDTEYVCYLVFKISEDFEGLHCPVKVQDFRQENQEAEILFFISPSPSNVHDFTHVPNRREDGWMEVNVWKFSSNQELKNGRHHVTLKFQSYEGTMSGLIVCGLDFRPA